jgi:hypothetical protein
MGILNQKNLWPTLIYQFEHLGHPTTDLSLLKEFSKKSVLKIFIILFEQDCPEAVVHVLSNCHFKFLNLPILVFLCKVN